jgi:predicted nucleotidyltransferase
MKPSLAFNSKRNAMRDVARRFHTTNLRVFGSVLHGIDKDGSDLDLLVDALPGTTMFDLGGLQDELEQLLGIPVDVRTPADLPLKFRNQVLLEAQPV